MKNLNKMLIASLLATSSVAVNAEVITYGSLSSDANYSVIADTEMGREYLRFDTFDLTYAETVAAIGVGGIYEGWAIADLDVANQFVDALTDGTGQVSGWVDNVFGASYDNVVYDMVSFIPTYGASWGGLILLVETQALVIDNHTLMENLDAYTVDGGTPINLLLYRENEAHIGGFNEYAAANDYVGPAVASVSAPLSTGVLLGVVGMLAVSRRK